MTQKNILECGALQMFANFNVYDQEIELRFASVQITRYQQITAKALTMFFSKTATVKLFFIISFSGFVTYATLAFYSFHTAYVTNVRFKNIQNDNKIIIYSDTELETIDTTLEKKYILMYSSDSNYYEDVIEGQYHFIKQRCGYRNCFLTTRSRFFKRDMRDYPAIVMNVKHLYYMKLPESRNLTQKYIFHGMEAPNHKLACREELDEYFNWTWSFKLGSDILSPFFEVRDLTGEVVAPKHNVRWSSEIARTYLKGADLLVFKKKTRAVAVFVKNCRVRGGKIYPNKLRSALEFYSLTLDIYGCASKCPNNTEAGCDKLIESDYYFVLIQEKIFADDYLTAEVLKAYWNSAVPLIRSGADLNSFLPTGSYINVRHNSVGKIAALIHYSINNPAVYYSYFRWKKFYTFHKNPTELNGLCELCAMLNSKQLMEKHTTHSKLRKWWYKGPIDENFCANITAVNTTALR